MTSLFTKFYVHLTGILLVTVVTLNVKYAVKTSHGHNIVISQFTEMLFKKRCVFFQAPLPYIFVYSDVSGAT
jgi:hypothetical protein